jgi:hypothetical protein
MLKKKSLHFSLLLISIGTGINIQAQPIPAEYLEQMVQQGKNPTREIMRNRSMDVYQKSMTVTAYNNLKGISLPLATSKEHIAYYLPDLQKIQAPNLNVINDPTPHALKPCMESINFSLNPANQANLGELLPKKNGQYVYDAPVTVMTHYMSAVCASNNGPLNPGYAYGQPLK